MLALCEAASGPRLSPAEALRELLHDAVEALLGGWDPITPLKPYLGDGFAQLITRIQAAIDTRYALPAWTPESYARHKQADRLAAANEAFHVAGWGLDAMKEHLGITLAPEAVDPLPAPEGMRPWQPWPPKIAEQRFLVELQSLSTAAVARRNWT